VTLLHRFGLKAFAWDVQETRYILAALRYGIDGIYCDRVDRMLATVQEWTSEQHRAGPGGPS
jgi:glycerophosphoryl diester phosphodiesterase